MIRVQFVPNLCYFGAAFGQLCKCFVYSMQYLFEGYLLLKAFPIASHHPALTPRMICMQSQVEAAREARAQATDNNSVRHTWMLCRFEGCLIQLLLRVPHVDICPALAGHATKQPVSCT